MAAEDPELVRLIERLRRLPADDIAAIVERLPNEHRALARSLLLQSSQDKDIEESVEATLSPWLADRLSQPDLLTSQAHRVLHECAGRLELGRPGSSSPSRPGLFERLRLGGTSRTAQP